MADVRSRMEGRLLRAALGRRKGMVALAVLAVAIGCSVAAALMHVSVDVSRKVGRELRALGPNLLLVPDAPAAPAPSPGSVRAFLDTGAARTRLAAEGLDGTLLLYATARAAGEPLQVIGAELERARAIHPSWVLSEGTGGNWMGVRLMARLGLAPGARVTLEFSNGESIDVRVGGVLEAGGPDDDAWWLPLDVVQRATRLEDKASLAQSRIDADADSAAAILSRLDGRGMRALPLHALSETEAGLLERMQRLMLLVSLAALAAGGLAAFGTLTDLALVRRREIALMKSLGARRRDVVRQFTAESLVIGAAGGIIGWLIGVVFAELIGQRVFHSAIALHPGVPLIVMALALGIAAIAGLGPIQLALRVQPADALKGD